MWNLDYSDLIAKEIKKRCKNCVIVYGGPQARKRPADKVIYKEGEISFANFLLEKDIDVERIKDLNSLPSPYLNGVFDHYFKKYDNYVLNAVLETNKDVHINVLFVIGVVSLILKFISLIYKEFLKNLNGSIKKLNI